MIDQTPMADQTPPQVVVPPQMQQQQMPDMGASNPNVTPQPAPADPNAVHDSIFGRAAKALLGHDTTYSIAPDGSTVSTETPQKPGQFFKNVLAAAILGGAAGSKNTSGSFLNAATQGASAVVGQNQQQDELKRKQAQQEFLNQQTAQKNDREARAFDTQEQVRKAQIAQANAETLRTNMFTQGEDYKTHGLVAAAGKQHFADYDAAGLSPVFKDIPESQMSEIMRNRPGASTFDWEPTSVKVVSDPETGKPSYEYTYSAYDPKGQIPVSQGTIDQWKKDGMDKYHPELFNILKPGKMLDASQYIELKRTDAKLFNDNLARTKAEKDTKEGDARVKLMNAQAAHALAEASTARIQGQAAGLSLKQSQLLPKALDELNKMGGDFSKITPGSRVVIGESMTKMLPSIEQEIKTANDAGDTATVHSLMLQADQVRSLAIQALGSGQKTTQVTTAPSPEAKITAAFNAVQNMSPLEAKSAIDSAKGLTPEEKKELHNRVDQKFITEERDNGGAIVPAL